MKQFVFTCLLLTVYCLLLFSSCSHEIINAAFQSTPVIVDAKANDWEIPLRFYDSETKLNYSISNDLNNIYICMRCTDGQVQKKIIKAGMEIWIDTTGKRKKEIGIAYPMKTGEKVDFDKKGEEENSDEGNIFNKGVMRQNFLSANKAMQLTGFHHSSSAKKNNSVIVPIQNKNGVNVFVSWDSTGTLIYEAKIPFSTFCQNNLSLSHPKVFSIGFYVNAIEMEDHPVRGSAGGGDNNMSNNNYGGSSIGTMQATGASGGRTKGSYGELAVQKKVWVRVKLADKQLNTF